MDVLTRKYKFNMLVANYSCWIFDDEVHGTSVHPSYFCLSLFQNAIGIQALFIFSTFWVIAFGSNHPVTNLSCQNVLTRLLTYSKICILHVSLDWDITANNQPVSFMSDVQCIFFQAYLNYIVIKYLTRLMQLTLMCGWASNHFDPLSLHLLELCAGCLLTKHVQTCIMVLHVIKLYLKKYKPSWFTLGY